MKVPVFCNDWIAIDEGILCALSNANGICILKDTGDVDYIYCMGENIDDINLFSVMISYMDKVVFVPYRAKHILVYQSVSKQFHEIDYGSKTSFWNVFVRGKIAIMFGKDASEILTFDLESEDIYSQKLVNTYFSTGSVCRKEDLYIPIGNDNSLLKYSFKTGEMKVEKLPCLLTGVDAIAEWKDSWIILGHDRDKCKLMLWNKSKNEIREYLLFIFDESEVQRNFHSPIVYDGKVYIFPYSNIDRYWVVDIEKEKCYRNEDFLKKIIPEENMESGLQFVKIKEDVICFQVRGTGAWGEYNIKTGEIISKKFFFIEDKKFTQRWNQTRFFKELENNSLAYEKEGYLEALIKQVLR